MGIDEVGRGPWAGPLVVGAVVLGGAEIPGLTDSKKLTKKRREALVPIIKEVASAWALGWVTANELDDIGMSEALKLATRRAVEQIKTPYSEIIIDGTINFLAETGKGKYVTCLPKADLLIPSVSAASVLAKVARDDYMAEQDAVYPGYGFTGHAGYGVAKHREAIEELGVTPLHRLSFAPLRGYTAQTEGIKQRGSGSNLHQNAKTNDVTTRKIGNMSETASAEYLKVHGHEILERNWRTRWCEIDIVSRKGDTIYFTEVKHRRVSRQGDGLEAVTPAKQRQMELAARMYVHIHEGTDQYDLRLAAIATTGDTPMVTQHILID